MSDILHRVGIDAKPDRVFNALTTIEGLRGWWSNTAIRQRRKGRPYQLWLLRYAGHRRRTWQAGALALHRRPGCLAEYRGHLSA